MEDLPALVNYPQVCKQCQFQRWHEPPMPAAAPAIQVCHHQTWYCRGLQWPRRDHFQHLYAYVQLQMHVCTSLSLIGEKVAIPATSHMHMYFFLSRRWHRTRGTRDASQDPSMQQGIKPQTQKTKPGLEMQLLISIKTDCVHWPPARLLLKLLDDIINPILPVLLLFQLQVPRSLYVRH
jgi:hypothetical protein